MLLSNHSTIFVVDDDEDLRDAIRLLLNSMGLAVETFGSAQDFLASFKPVSPSCLILDVRMPGMCGPELQEKLRENNINIPVLIITGHGDVATTVRAIKGGAIDVIEKPFKDQKLLELVQKALQQDELNRQDQEKHEKIATRLDLLTPRETQVLHGLMKGDPNKVIAANLEISTRTVEIHRARIMTKIQARALSTLVQMVLLVRPNLFQNQEIIAENQLCSV